MARRVDYRCWMPRADQRYLTGKGTRGRGAKAGIAGPVLATPEHHLDALIFGGGIAGLWTLSRLVRAGYRALLLTDQPLGAGQTILSQGIIHGGIKYTLGLAEPGEASRAIAEMPAIWSACLEGKPAAGDPDLRAAQVLAPAQHLWTTPGLGSRLAGLGAARAIRTAVEKLAPDDRPDLLRAAPRGLMGIEVYRVAEPVLDVRSVVAALATPLADRIIPVNWPGDVRFDLSDQQGRGEIRALQAVELLGPCRIRLVPKRTLLLAGAGNQALSLAISGGGPPVPMQRRPLHMVMMRRAPGPLFGHCLGASTVPRITISSARTHDGEWVWYIGGQIAETGVDRSEHEQVAHARGEIQACLPWLDCSEARFATLRIDRAEPSTEGGRRPDGPVLTEYLNLLIGWPTKLAFAPMLANMAADALRAAGIVPTGDGRPAAWRRPAALPPAALADYPWNTSDIEWRSA